MLLALLLWREGPTLLARVTATSAPPARIQSLSFYRQARYRTCVPLSARTASFPASTARIYNIVRFTSWSGRHTFTAQWYAPNGNLYESDTLTDDNVGRLCSYMRVYGDDAAGLTGQWQFRASVDGNTLKSESFTVRPVGPDPRRLVLPSMCKKGCSARLRNPSGVRVHKNFPAYGTLIRYLRRHPGTRIEMISGNPS